jgi:hypothetical protein
MAALADSPLQLKQLSAGGKHAQFDAAAVSTFCNRVDAFVDRSRAQLAVRCQVYCV